jgi:hypothetical protein
MHPDDLISEMLHDIKADIRELSTKLTTHIEDEEDALKELTDKVTAVELSPHHIASHTFVDTLMLREEKKMKLWDAIIEKSIASLVYGGMVALLVAVGTYIKAHWNP